MHRLLFVMLAILSALAPVSAAPTEAILIVTGDQHSAYERTAQFVAHIDRVRGENPGVPLAVLINGDTFELGNVVAERSGGAVEFAMFAALARRAPTVVNLGNHEPEFYDPAATVERIRATGATVIGNLAERGTGQLFAPASTRLRLGEHEIAIAGLTTDMLSQYRAAVRPTLDLAAPAAWAEKHFPTLLGDAPIAVVMSHAGLRNDRGVFAHVPKGSLYLGAHDHTQFVHRDEALVYVQSGAWNSHFSVVRLRAAGGRPVWDVEQVAISAADP
ncbi:MAG TPA: metallophosphoesterase, partial [Opitutus sp.]|nr:metallophosphoesterase [Opitutus sp.]